MLDKLVVLLENSLVNIITELKSLKRLIHFYQHFTRTGYFRLVQPVEKITYD